MQPVNDPDGNAFAAAARRQRMLEVIAAIPSGRVASYGQIAALAGAPRAARQVAAVLGRAPAAAGLPWHRVVNARGEVAIPPGRPARREQIARLRAEGVGVVAGRVRLQVCGWRPELADLLWGPAPPDSDL